MQVRRMIMEKYIKDFYDLATRSAIYEAWDILVIWYFANLRQI